MNLTVMLLSLAGAVVVEALVPPLDFIGGAKPPMVAGVIVYYALCRPYPLMLTASVAGGLLEDCMAGYPVGVSGSCYILIALVVYRNRDVIFVHDWMTRLVFGFFAGLVINACLFVMLSLSRTVVLAYPADQLFLRIVGAGIAGMVSVPLVADLVERFDITMGNVLKKEKNGAC